MVPQVIKLTRQDIFFHERAQIIIFLHHTIHSRQLRMKSNNHEKLNNLYVERNNQGRGEDIKYYCYKTTISHSWGPFLNQLVDPWLST